MTQNIIIKPFDKELPSHYAERLGLYYSSLVSDEHKKDLGQFFTPHTIASFMSGFCGEFRFKQKLRILDPGCGIGILSTCLIENLADQNVFLKTIDLVVFETDTNIIKLTENCFSYLRLWLDKKGIEFRFFLCKNDFILHNSNILNNYPSDELYDIVISNPPYFKLPKNDERIKAAKSVIHGQSNIYTIFMIIASMLLDHRGKLVFITPRSFCSGSYFRLFREQFFTSVSIDFVHLFNSRKKAFGKDKVLQENIIIVAQKKKKNIPNQLILPFLNTTEEVIISSSNGIDDLNERISKKYYWKDLINIESYQKILHLPSSNIDEEVIKIFKTWTGSLNQYDLQISTGPIVAFRSLKSITQKKYKNSVPLIWLHNVDCMKLTWPKIKITKNKIKEQYVLNNDSVKLIPNQNFVLLRRFSSKDDSKRLIATPYLKNMLDFPFLGIENHLNYIYHKQSELTKIETIGLAALLNSRLFDIYFRTFNGNINVSATELKDFPLPDYELIKLLGQEITNIKELDSKIIDSLVSKIFDLKIDLCNYG